MMLLGKFALAAVVALLGAGALYPLCGTRAAAASAQSLTIAFPTSDTATVKLHISGMTCGSCPITARIALERLPGVLDTKVTLDDSLGVVRYDPRRVTPEQITAHLTKLTGYGARVLADTSGTGAR